MKKKRYLLGAAGIALLALVGVTLRPRPIPVDLVRVERGGLQVTIDEEGVTRVRDRFIISAPVGGRVLRIDLRPGNPVVANETVLAFFEPVDPGLLDARTRAESEAFLLAAEAALGRAEANRDRASAENEFHKVELARYRQLAADAVVSRDQLEAAELRARAADKGLSVARFEVQSARHGLDQARARLLFPGPGEQRAGGEPIAIRSPVDGVVLRVWSESEAVVPIGQPLLEVANPADLEIVSDLLSTDAVRVRAGEQVRIEQWGGAEDLVGTVRRVEPSGFTKVSALGVEEQRVNVIIDFADPRAALGTLGDGYRVEVRIVIWENADVLKVPVSTLFRSQGEFAVFALEAGRAALRQVTIGHRNGLAAEVLSGLSEGMMLVAYPSDAVEDGVAVAERPR